MAATAEIQVSVDPTKASPTGSTAAQIAGEIRRRSSPRPSPRSPWTPGRPRSRRQGPRCRHVRRRAEPGLGRHRRQGAAQAGREVEQVDVQGSITRIDGAPAAQITAEITSADTGAVSADVKETIDGLAADGTIPAGVEVELAGVTEQQNEAFGGLFTSMAVAILLVYVMLVLTFNSLITPFIIMFSLPLATIGAFPALFLTGRPIGVSALIGFLMLIGIVVTNAIVLLDLVERLRRRAIRHAMRSSRAAEPGSGRS